MNEEELKELVTAWEFTKDLWQFIKKHYFPPSDPDAKYWKDIMSGAEELVGKYNNHRLAQKLTLAFLDYVEEVARDGRQ